MDRYEYIIYSIPIYIRGYMTMPMNIGSITSVAGTLEASFFAAFPIGYSFKIGLARKEEIELEYSVLIRNSRTIQSSSNVVLM